MRLKGRVAVITGGARGIGKATALLFAKHGAIVIICDVNESEAANTISALKAVEPRCLFAKVDVTSKESIEQMVNGTVTAFGGIDILVNNAGVTQDATLAKMTERQWDLVLNINLKGTFNCTQAVLPVMLQRQHGKVINVASVVGLYGNVGQSNYAASKFGVIGLTKTWAKELGKKGINVNAVAPGFTMTEMMQTVPEKILASIAERTPLRRLGQPDEIAAAILFLASDEANYVNGAVLSVDGGLTL